MPDPADYPIVPDNAWAPPQQPPQYHAALSDAWHQNYAKNDPEGYAAAHPEVRSAYDRVTALLHGLAQTTDPFGGASSQPISGPNALSTVASGLRTGMMGVPEIAGPLSAMRLTGNVITPTAAGNGELSPADQRKQQITDIEGKITAEQGRRAAEVDKIPKTIKTYDQNGNFTGRVADPAIVSTKTATFDQNIANWRSQLNPLYAAQSAATSEQEQSEKPFAQSAPQWAKTALRWGPPAFDFASSLPLGAFVKPAAAYGVNALQGLILGGIGAMGPEYSDLALPEGSPGRIKAEQNLTDPRYWAYQVAPEVGGSIAAGMLGTVIGQKVGAGYRAFKGGTPPANALATPASPSGGTSIAPALTSSALKPAYTTPEGRDVFLGRTGKPQYRDSANRWRHVTGGKMVAKPDQP